MSYMTTSERQMSLSAEIGSVKTRAEFAQALGRSARAFGFEHVTLMNAATPENILSKALVIETTLQSAYFNQFDRARMMSAPHFSAGLHQSTLPRVWNNFSATSPIVLTSDLKELLLSYGMTMGVTFPAYLVDGERVVIWYGGDRAPLGQIELNELMMITHHLVGAYNLVRQSGANASLPTLSAREREVVRWTAQGKTSIEIGQILSLSDHTVNAYMTSAIRKLDCVNRTQLVAKAIRMKLIS
ncbi:LuxR C-terminal-related transcriptional regulator [Rhizobium sp. S152]|uniref:helix-turn-helix transcriptional regulator n=1 Tax=Rhizobium sp. S152 TaxID=3055038 RepID=UPI0025A9B220|nr:LuxR family transcriptional regulator [Rhizobium sp. S152]MDM9628880.1 LuxR C-terminal-related transcriptional regulator [Rhizobium sp. S152]